MCFPIFHPLWEHFKKGYVFSYPLPLWEPGKSMYRWTALSLPPGVTSVSGIPGQFT